MRTGYADLPLHGGKAPKWLFERMVKLSTVIVEALLTEFSREEFLKRISDPVWFQSLGNVLGFDWHSSGLSTVTAGAIKEAIRKISKTTGLFAAGGKGKYALKTPDTILNYAEKYSFNPLPLIKASRLSAKVDNSCIQDGFSIYHHTIFFTDNGKWSVVQQGLKSMNKRARRYHWLSDKVIDFAEEPHTGIDGGGKGKKVLNLISKNSKKNKAGIIEILRQKPEKFEKEIVKLIMPSHHNIEISDILFKNLKKISLKAYSSEITEFIDILNIKGTGPKTLRALSLTAAVIYGVKPSFEDPVIFSYAHGGKDGTPYPVDRKNYDRTIEVIGKAIKKSKMGNREKMETLKRLSNKFIGGENGL
jgi:hypothetical protein